jgi:hypothetical protein
VATLSSVARPLVRMSRDATSKNKSRSLYILDPPANVSAFDIRSISTTAPVNNACTDSTVTTPMAG